MTDRKNRSLFSFIIQLFFAFTVMIFGPYEIFISNSSDFNFTFRDFWWMPLSAAIVYIIISITICTFLPKIISDLYNLLVFSFTLCCYIQAMFLNNKMKVLIGEQVIFSRGTIIINIIIWGFIFLTIFLIKHFAVDNWSRILQFISSALILMQLVALFFLFITTDALSEEKTGYISQKGMLELSQNKNVIVFILDFFDGRTMDSILSKNPDILESLEGFTYFPNHTSVYSRTYPSITYLLTGNKCYFDQSPNSYVNSSYEKSTFLPTLYKNQIDVGLYTFENYIGANTKSQIINYIPSHLSLKYFNTVKYMLKMALYRDMPYIVKQRFSYDVYDINNNVTSNERIQRAAEAAKSDSLIPEYKNFDDEWFAETLEQNKLTLTDSAGSFRFYHLGSCHLDLTNPEPYGIRSLNIVYDYLTQLKELGIYEDSTIIIVSDHGSSGGGNTLDLPQKTAVPLLIVKPSGTFNENVKISNAPVSHTDFIPTIMDGFSLEYSDYGKTFFDIHENEKRERYYYYTALYTNEDGEVELREYRINGDARYHDNYHFTGNAWDIQYSENAIAK